MKYLTSVMIIGGMFLSGSYQNDVHLPLGQPLFVLSGQTVLVSPGLFAALRNPANESSPLLRPEGRCLSTKVGDDVLAELDTFLSDPADYYCVELESFSLEKAILIGREYPGETIYILCPILSGVRCQALPQKSMEFQSESDSWVVFVNELVGLPQTRKKEPERKIRVTKKPLFIEPVAKEELSFCAPEAKIKEGQERSSLEAPQAEEWQEEAAESLENGATQKTIKTKEKPVEFKEFLLVKHGPVKISKRIGRDGLNPLFSIIFIGLGFATFLGYFFLGEESTELFRIACIIMSALFPFMSCIPMGFLFHDLKIKKLSDSNFMVLALSLILGLSILLPCLGLSIGNSLGWNESDLLLFTLLGLSSPLWILFRVFLARFLLKKAKEGKKS